MRGSAEKNCEAGIVREVPYREVRALDRGLHIINTLGEIGWAGPARLAEETGIDRSTIYRLLATLERAGFVVCRPQDSKYFLSSRFRHLSDGIRKEDSWARLTFRPMRNLLEEIKWPSEFAMLTAGRMVIIDSTHPQSSMTFYRSTVGQTRPILASALGRALLSGMTVEERADAIERIFLAGGPDAADMRNQRALDAVIAEFNRRGYAVSSGTVADNVSAIAMPVRTGGHVVGALNIMFFRSVFKSDEIAPRYLDALKSCVCEIERALDHSEEGGKAP